MLVLRVFLQAVPVQQPTRPVRLHGNTGTSEFSTLTSLRDPRWLVVGGWVVCVGEGEGWWWWWWWSR